MIRIPPPPTPEDAAALELDERFFGFSVRDSVTGARVSPRPWLMVAERGVSRPAWPDPLNFIGAAANGERS